MRNKAQTARIEDLLQHADWLRRIAAGLGGDDEDVLQDTWVAALKSPPSSDRPVRPWLATVLRNFARNRWRAGRVRQRAQPAQTAPEESSGTPQELLERAQLQCLLAELVLELPEPYRSTVMLRYHEGRTSAEIARILEVPAGTVRWRLKEGLEHLRRGLDARHGGDRSRWMPVLLPLLRVPPGRRPGTALESLEVAASSGVVLAVAVLALVVLSAVGVALWRVRQVDAGRSDTMATRGRALPLVVKEAALPPASVDGAVKDPAGRTIVGAVVVLSRAASNPATAPAAVAVSDGNGRFRFDAAPGEHLVSATADGFTAALGHRGSVRPTAPSGSKGCRKGAST